MNSQHKSDPKSEILLAAQSLFKEKGLDGLSMRAIATRAGIPTMTLYSHFAGKTAIIRALWALIFPRLFLEMRTAEESADTAKERLYAVSLAYVLYWTRNPDHYRMVHMVEDRRDQSGSPWFIDETNVVESHLHIASLIAALRDESAEECIVDAEALTCALTGIAHMMITVSEYIWAAPATYVDRIVSGFSMKSV